MEETIGELLGLVYELEEVVIDDDFAEEDVLEVEVGAAVRHEQAALISPSVQLRPSLFGNGISKRSKNSQNCVGSATSAVFVNVAKQLAVLQPSGVVGDRLAACC